jgi:SAM-dependent methyltransferase
MIDERSENAIYKLIIEDQLRSPEGRFCPFRREKQMDYLFSHLRRDFDQAGQKVLDMCGGYGRLTYFLNELDSRQEYYCFDSSETLIALARDKFAGNRNIHCEVADLYLLTPQFEKKFDVTVNYKTLSYLPYYEQAIAQLVKATRKKVYITSQFFDGDVDFISRIYERTSERREERYSYLNCYAVPRFVDYCHSLGVRKVEFEDMRLDIDLDPPADRNELKTYTIQTRDQGRLEVNGVVILNWKLAILTL